MCNVNVYIFNERNLIYNESLGWRINNGGNTMKISGENSAGAGMAKMAGIIFNGS